MTIVQLAEVAKVDSGAGFPLEHQGCQDERFPFLKVSDMNLEGNERRIISWNHSVSESIRSKLRAKAFPAGSLIFPKIGAAIGTNKKRQLIRPSCVDNNVMAVVPDTSKLNPDYLYFAFLAKNISDFASASNPPSIRKPDVENWKLPVPSLVEQVRVVEILTRAESIVRLRRQAKQKAAELVPAIFRRMFGDPDANLRGLQLRKVSDFVAQFQGGKNIQSGSDDPNGLRILKVSAVTSGRYLESESKPAPNNYVPPASHFVRVGDMLFSRANTVDLVGATALVENTDGNTLLPDKLWRIIWSEDVDVFYMHTLFQDTSVRRMLGKLATGTSDSMRNISQAKLFNLELPVAPLEEQRKFGLLARQAISMMSTQELGLVKACQSFDSLMSNAFNQKGT